MVSEETSRSLRASELARAVGVSTDTLRHYERLGLACCRPYLSPLEFLSLGSSAPVYGRIALINVSPR